MNGRQKSADISSNDNDYFYTVISIPRGAFPSPYYSYSSCNILYKILQQHKYLSDYIINHHLYATAKNIKDLSRLVNEIPREYLERENIFSPKNSSHLFFYAMCTENNKQLTIHAIDECRPVSVDKIKFEQLPSPVTINKSDLRPEWLGFQRAKDEDPENITEKRDKWYKHYDKQREMERFKKEKEDKDRSRQVQPLTNPSQAAPASIDEPLKPDVEPDLLKPDEILNRSKPLFYMMISVPSIHFPRHSRPSPLNDYAFQPADLRAVIQKPGAMNYFPYTQNDDFAKLKDLKEPDAPVSHEFKNDMLLYAKCSQEGSKLTIYEYQKVPESDNFIALPDKPVTINMRYNHPIIFGYELGKAKLDKANEYVAALATRAYALRFQSLHMIIGIKTSYSLQFFNPLQLEKSLEEGNFVYLVMSSAKSIEKVKESMEKLDKRFLPDSSILSPNNTDYQIFYAHFTYDAPIATFYSCEQVQGGKTIDFEEPIIVNLHSARALDFGNETLEEIKKLNELNESEQLMRRK